MNIVKKMLILTTAMVSASSVAQGYELSLLPISADNGSFFGASLDISSILYQDEAVNYTLYNFETDQSTKLPGLKGRSRAVMSSDGKYIYGASPGQEDISDILYKDGEYKEVPHLDEWLIGISSNGILVFNRRIENPVELGSSWVPNLLNVTTGDFSRLKRGFWYQSFANNISKDGSTVVGNFFDEPFSNKAVKWDTKSLEYTLLNSSSDLTDAQIVNDDGSFFVGSGGDWLGAPGFSNIGAHKLYLWRDGSADPEIIYEGESSLDSYDITESGDMIVGGSNEDQEFNRAFYWRRDEGIVFLADKLSKAGIDVQNIPLDIAVLTSGDGSIILGFGDEFQDDVTPKIWLARIASTSDVANKANSKNNGIGVINLADTGRSLESIRTIAPKIVTANVTDSQRLAGQNCFSAEQSFCAFVTASSGYQDQDSNINSLSQVGIGYQILPSLYFGGSIGYRYLGADLYNEGEFSSNALNTSLWASYNQNQSGFNAAASLGYSWGRIDTERRYRNGSRLETAKGDTGYQAYAGTLKVGYGFDLGRKLLLNPFADVSYGQARIDGFTEDSGNFRAKYEDQKGNYWQSNIGLEAVYKATDIVSFSALAAWGQGDGNDIDFTGNIIGTNNWARNESKTEQARQDWTHLALGADWKIGKNMSLGLDVGGNIGRSDDHQADIYSSVKFQIAF